MAAKTNRIGLMWAVLGSFALALAFVLFALFVVVPLQVGKDLTDTLYLRGKVVAQETKRRVMGSVTAYDSAAELAVEAATQSEPEIRLAALIACPKRCENGTVIAQAAGDPTLLNAAIQRFDQAGRADRVGLPPQSLLVSERLDPLPVEGDVYVLLALDTANIEQSLSSLRWRMALVLGIGSALFLFLLWVVSRLFVLGPLHSMQAMASQLSESDLTGRVDEPRTAELGGLADALNSIAQTLRDTLTRVRGVSDGIGTVIDQIARTGHTVSSGSGTVLSSVEETSSSMAQMMASLRGIAENVEVLYQSAEESSSSITQMAATNDEVAENVQAMAASVEETTAAIEEMTFSIKEVAKNIEALLASTEETSSSMNEMDVSIGQVETNANETARLSEQVSKDAETGVETLQKTIAGIDKIKESSRAASSVIEHLGKRIQEIGNILNVIDDVAEQTNLLALNAAIIAAQAGEHGKGFAVVADEIKDLAERTGVSTKEIADLIRGVQEESVNAVKAMNQGVRSVEEGVQLGREAQGALKKIYESANKSTMMVKAIARATVEQSRGSKAVTASIHRIVEAVGQINKATHEQARGSEQIMKGAEKMKLLTSHVQRSAQEQAHGSKQITRSIESINEMVTFLNRAQKEQTKGSEQVLKAVEAIKMVSDHQNRSVKQLEEAIELLRRQADVLRGEVRRFRV